MKELLPAGFRQQVPPVNVKETDATFEMEVAAPGLAKEDLNVKVHNGVLTVSGKHEKKSEEADKQYTRREFSYTSFSRSFSLPEAVDEDKIQAACKDGVVMLTLPKRAAVSPKGEKQIAIS